MRKTIVTLFLAQLACSFGLHASSELTIYTETFPPYNFLERGRVRGINADMVLLACQKAKINCTFELYPWRRSMALALKNTKSGLVSTSRLPSREADFKWVGPLISSPACFYKLASRADIKITSKADLIDYTVGLQQGDVYQEILNYWGFEEQKNYIMYGEKFGDVKAFKEGKLDLFIASANSLSFHIQSHNLPAKNVEPAFVIDDTRLGGNYLALNKGVDDLVLKKLQQAIDDIYKSRSHLEIKKRYVTSVEQIPESEMSLARRCVHPEFK